MGRCGAGDHNTPYDWHLDPEETEIADVTIELCDSSPVYVQEHLDEWIETVGRYCPWGAELVSLRDFR
ncbi:MAG: hypothetical protein FJ318_01080 [SAR202 cluster bacterium]|nr:hypothetical protein [SAR202 cluster bacterium]